MQATLELPEPVVRELEALARREGVTVADLLKRLVEAHVKRSESNTDSRLNVSLPLIPASETGPIQPVTGADVDELLGRDHLTT